MSIHLQSVGVTVHIPPRPERLTGSYSGIHKPKRRVFWSATRPLHLQGQGEPEELDTLALTSTHSPPRSAVFPHVGRRREILTAGWLDTTAGGNAGNPSHNGIAFAVFLIDHGKLLSCIDRGIIRGLLEPMRMKLWCRRSTPRSH
jgi:hypothetical protein